MLPLDAALAALAEEAVAPDVQRVKAAASGGGYTISKPKRASGTAFQALSVRPQVRSLRREGRHTTSFWLVRKEVCLDQTFD